MISFKFQGKKEDVSDLAKFVMRTLVYGVHMKFYMPKKGYTVPGNQGIHDKLNQIRNF